MLAELADSDLPDLDRSIMCVNGAVVSDKLGRTEDALAWFDRAIRLEPPQHRHFAAERRAAYLFERGRWTESLASFQDLLAQPHLMEEDRERIRGNIETIKQHMVASPAQESTSARRTQH